MEPEIGEYIGRIYAEVKRRPLYVVEERLGFGDNATKLVRSAQESTRETASVVSSP